MAKEGTYVYKWPRPMVTVDSLIFAADGLKTEVLLIRRGFEPFKGFWAIPGGFVEMDEELRDAANRELHEETGVSGIKLEQMHTFRTIGRDPRGRQITVVYSAVISQKPVLKAGDDAARAKWFDIENLPETAFDHKEIIQMGIEKNISNLK